MVPKTAKSVVLSFTADERYSLVDPSKCVEAAKLVGTVNREPWHGIPAGWVFVTTLNYYATFDGPGECIVDTTTRSEGWGLDVWHRGLASPFQVSQRSDFSAMGDVEILS